MCSLSSSSSPAATPVPLSRPKLKRKSSRSFSFTEGSSLATERSAQKSIDYASYIKMVDGSPLTPSGVPPFPSPGASPSPQLVRVRASSSRTLKTVRSFDNLEDLKRECELGIEKEKTPLSQTRTAVASKEVFRGGDVIQEGIVVKTSHTIVSHRHYKTICIGALCTFVLLHLSMEVHHRVAKDPVCALERKLPPWARECITFIGGGLVFAIIMQCSRISLSTFRESGDLSTKSSYIASLCAMTLAALGNLAVVYDPQWGGFCLDSFGVITPSTIWVEWLVSVPLMVFIASSVDDKPYLSSQDLSNVASSFGTIFFGALNQVIRNPGLGALTVVLSSICCCTVYFQLKIAYQEKQVLVDKLQGCGDIKKGKNQRKLLLASRKITLLTCICCIFPLFPGAYFLRCLGVVGDDMFIVLSMVSSALAKVLFGSCCMDAHLEVSHPAIALIDAENFGNTSRRAFIRYVFHEIRVPLNSVALGVQILSHHMQEMMPDRIVTETVGMLRDAVNFMGDTLNDVMALQKVEEGSLELIYKPFSIHDLFQNIEDTFIEMCASSNVTLETVVDNKMPTRLIGDKFRLRHVLCNLISNAIKFSNSGSVVRLTVDCEGTIDEDFLPKIIETGLAKYIKFQVIDEGRGISKEDQESDIFSPFSRLQHGELKAGRGSGLGLAICREIVHMHGGQISYVSVLGEGTTFTVVLPLEISFHSSVGPSQGLQSFANPPVFPGALVRQDSGRYSTPRCSGRSTASSSTTNSNRSSASEEHRTSRRIETHFQVLMARPNSIGSLSQSQPMSPVCPHILSARSRETKTDFAPLLPSLTEQQSASDSEQSPGEILTPVQEEDELVVSSQSSMRNSDTKLEPNAGRDTEARNSSPDRRRYRANDVELSGPIPIVEQNSRKQNESKSMEHFRERMKNMKVDIPPIPIGNLVESKNDSPSILSVSARSSFDRSKAHLKVLIVDDVASNRKLLAMLLQQKGVGRVEFAEDGAKGVEEVKKKGLDFYSFIFMDNTMPVMTGIEATKALRKEGFGNLIIGLTGNAMADELVEFTQVGADLAISKPISHKTLESLLNYVVKHGCVSQGGKKLSDIEPEFARP